MSVRPTDVVLTLPPDVHLGADLRLQQIGVPVAHVHLGEHQPHIVDKATRTA